MTQDFLENLNRLISIYIRINNKKPTILNVTSQMLSEISDLTHTHNLNNKSGDKLIEEMFGLTIRTQDKEDFIFWIE